MVRFAEIKRDTRETHIRVSIELDGSGCSNIKTPIPFLNHMLEQVSRHGYFDLEVQAEGDVEIDDHHTVEDIGIVLGQVFAKALGDKKGICRFSSVSVPLNEALVNCIVDISGRPFLVFKVDLPKAKLGTFDVELVEEFFQAFSANSGITLHVNSPYWSNQHHVIEATFKAFARALDLASCLEPRSGEVPSTKGKL